jgi:diaminopimelate epimerase
VFERGEGWTKSFGSSVTAVASAARHLGHVTATTAGVAMLALR